MLVGDYMPGHFQALPTLEAARAKFRAINGDELVKGVFRPFFVDGGMEKRLGLTILHRHFDLNADERLVDYNGTSLPWPAAPTQGIEEPYASIWSKAADGTFRPTEYRYSQNHKAAAIGPAELSFMEEFDKLLQHHDASDLFGLCLYPGDDFEGSCEITVGRANINLKPADYPSDLQVVDTTWFFSAPLWTQAEGKQELVLIVVWAKELGGVYDAEELASKMGYSDSNADNRKPRNHRDEYLVDRGIGDEYRVLAVFEGGGPDSVVTFECSSYRIKTTLPNGYFTGRDGESPLEKIGNEIYRHTGVRDDSLRDYLVQSVARTPSLWYLVGS
ncbi:uncharacterized protein GIQ15_04284 [Arthroderma uncinatum]|nr:uncharacterized protein GIQ15_04284 [Arthroderma uncinatum]KAF3481525.1 hypothetical protein GIQ15_04284 [Arthroderma uncinatum]